MIVLSILTALALERGAIALHDASAARASRGRIEAELAADLADARVSEQSNAANVQIVRDLLTSLLEQMKHGKPDDARLVAAAAAASAHFSISLPSARRDAWESAIADQSASHLRAPDLQRYAEIYAFQRDMEASAQLLLSGEFLQHGSELRLDIALGHVDAHDLARRMIGYIRTAGQIQAAQANMASLITSKT